MFHGHHQWTDQTRVEYQDNTQPVFKIFLRCMVVQRAHIKATSYLKNPEQDKAWFLAWVKRLSGRYDRDYRQQVVDTALGRTVVWTLGVVQKELPALFVFPGARTTSLIWDLDRNLDALGKQVQVYLVETNGQPNLSDGSSPDIRSLDYGHWAAELIEKLGHSRVYVAGASFGGLVCMQLAILHPEKVLAAFLLNPGCLLPFSLMPFNVFCNLLPLVIPTAACVRYFLNKVVFYKEEHTLSCFAFDMLVEYQLWAIRHYKDNTEKPYYMDEQLRLVKSPVYLLIGDKDLLFPYKRSLRHAQDQITTLREIQIYSDVGHGIETYHKALEYIGERIKILEAH